MSTELSPACELQANTADVHGTPVGGSKPLHRFIRGQPKIIGIVVLILGSCFFVVSISMVEGAYLHLWEAISPGFWLGSLFIICGIVYILTEHRPTKKTVTLSLGLSIVAILASIWVSFFNVLPTVVYTRTTGYERITRILQAVFEFYIFVCLIIFIVMSSLAGAALRSSRSQALVVMTTTPTE